MVKINSNRCRNNNYILKMVNLPRKGVRCASAHSTVTVQTTNEGGGERSSTVGDPECPLSLSKPLRVRLVFRYRFITPSTTSHLPLVLTIYVRVSPSLCIFSIYSVSSLTLSEIYRLSLYLVYPLFHTL